MKNPSRRDLPRRGFRRDERPASASDTGVGDARIVCGRRAVEEALRAASPVRHLYVLAGSQGGEYRQLVDQARERRVKTSFVDRDGLDRLSAGQRHQGAVAVLDPFAYADPEQLIQEVARNRGLLVVLDSVQDPQNLGAVIRSAEAFGAGGLLIPKDRQAPVTPAAERAAAGATAHLPVARIGNLARMLTHLKEMGYWIVGADANEGVDPGRLDLDRPLALVLGSEEKGIRPLNLKQCDARVRIPLTGRVASLNVSVAAGVLLYALAVEKGNR